MLDTIHFRIRNLQVHENLKIALLEKSYSGKSIRRFEVDEDMGKTISRSKLAFKYLHYFDSGNSSTVVHFNELKSHHYSIAYKVDLERDYIEVNLSLPKWLYGTNVLQLIPHHFDRGHGSYCTANSPLDIANEYYAVFLSVFKYLLHRYFDNPRLDLIEIIRLDFCYNQVFDSKEDCDRYFDLVKTRNKKYQRINANNAVSYNSSLFVKNRHYSFKIYKKGVEFEKHDKRKLFEYNKNNAGHFNIESLQELADKTLRYEMTMRSSWLNYLYNYRIAMVRESWKESYDYYKKFYGKTHLLSELNLKERRSIKEKIEKVKRFLNKQKTVKIRSDYPDLEIRLSPKKFGVFLKHFWEQVDHFQIENQSGKVHSIGELMRQARADQEYGGKNFHVSESTLVEIMSLLDHYTLDEIKTKGIFKKTKFDRIKAFLKRYDVNVKTSFTITVAKRVDFLNYYSHLMYSKHPNLKKLPL